MVRKTLVVSLLWLAIVSLAQAQEAVSITEKTEGGAPTVVLENAFVRMTFRPGQGGECTDFVFKPTGKRLVMPNVGSLLGSRVWNYADRELYTQWQKCAWEHQILRKGNEVTLVLKARGQAGFTRSTIFEKRVSLRAGEAMARVEHVFHVGQELMVPRKIGLWFYNRAGVVGEHTVYTFPLDDAIVTVDPAAGAGQEWYYNPSRGWAALTGDSGNGLCFNMEYRRLMCFYLCPGKQPTFEWAFRTFDVKNGESFRTQELIVPFQGIKRVCGSGNGIVAGFSAPENCTLAEAQKGLSVRASLASGAPVTGRVVVTLRRLPDGQEQTVHEAEVTLEPGKCANEDIVVKVDREGTWVLSGRVMKGEKELMDFMTQIVVGEKSAPFRIAAKEERMGRKSERFEDRTPLRGTAPKDIELSMEVESEHVQWAKPYCKGKTKVMVLTSCLSGREAVELGERMDMDLIWVTAGSKTELGYISGVFGRNKSYLVEHMNQYIKEKLAQPCDVILIGGLRGDLFDDEVIQLFRKKIEEGVGLVYVAPNRGPEALYSFLPVEKEKHLRRRNGEWRAAKAHPITVGVPFDVLPRTDYTWYKAKTDPIAMIGKGPLVIAQEGPGKGRVVVFSYNTGWQGSGGFQCPWLEPPDTHVKYWEYHLSMVIRAVLWAARKEPGVALKEIKIDNAETPKVVMDLSNPGDPLSVSAQVTVNGPLGEQAAQFTKDISLKAGDNEVKLDLPDDLPGGGNLVDIILKSEGKVVNWGSVSCAVDRGVALSN
ncbi:MAG: hypothetical protein GXP25_02945, partial [Planctomycetes bacterium]|nr:hypothetical protein [Planctomycetota bacterium]